MFAYALNAQMARKMGYLQEEVRVLKEALALLRRRTACFGVVKVGAGIIVVPAVAVRPAGFGADIFLRSIGSDGVLWGQI